MEGKGFKSNFEQKQGKDRDLDDDEDIFSKSGVRITDSWD